MQQGVSVVICCYNSSSRLPATLDHLLVQQTAGIKWEVIIVDNASTDDTFKVAESYKNKFHEIAEFSVIQEPSPGLSHARKAGLEHAVFEYILFCDDDNWLDEDYMIRCFALLSKEASVAAVGGRGVPVFETSEPDWFNLFERPYAVGKAAENSGIITNPAGFLTGAGMMIRRQIWLHLHDAGFSSLLSDRKGNNLSSGGDLELCFIFRLLGLSIYYLDEVAYRHFIPAGRLTHAYLRKLHDGIGKSSAYLGAYQHLINGLPIKKKFVWLRVTFLMTPKLFKSLNTKTTLKEEMETRSFRAYYQEMILLNSRYDKALKYINEIVARVKPIISIQA
jgi:glycosyltransferase involved in cell wall biosynthesis